MKKRFFTSLVILIVYVGTLLLSVYVHPVFFDIFVLILMMGAGMEMSKALTKKFSKPMDAFVLINILVGYLAFILVHNFLGKGSGGITAFFGVLALVFVACMIYNMFSKTQTMRNVVSTIFVLVYPVALLVYMLGVNYLSQPYRVSALLLIFIVSVLTDTFAYLVGSALKGPKLCPKISPKKTISGACGGLLGGLLGGAVVLLFSLFGIFEVLPLVESTAANIIHFLVLGLFGSVFTQLGDLTASYIKRTCEIKDYGSILPGHGGVLDRIDGMMLSAVFVYIYMAVLAVL